MSSLDVELTKEDKQCFWEFMEKLVNSQQELKPEYQEVINKLLEEELDKPILD